MKIDMKQTIATNCSIRLWFCMMYVFVLCRELWKTVFSPPTPCNSFSSPLALQKAIKGEPIIGSGQDQRQAGYGLYWIGTPHSIPKQSTVSVWSPNLNRSVKQAVNQAAAKPNHSDTDCQCSCHFTTLCNRISATVIPANIIFIIILFLLLNILHSHYR